MKNSFPKNCVDLHRSFRLAALVFAANACLAQAQDGYYDDSWGAGGRLMVDVGPFHDNGLTMAIQADGKLLPEEVGSRSPVVFRRIRTPTAAVQ